MVFPVGCENPKGKKITYAYDSLSQRDSMVDPDNGRTTYLYDVAGRMTWLETCSGGPRRRSRPSDSLGRCTSLGRAVNRITTAAFVAHVFAAQVAPTRAAKGNLQTVTSSADDLRHVS